MSISNKWILSLIMAMSLGLAACAPPSEQSQAENDQTMETEEAPVEEAAAEETAPPPPPPPPPQAARPAPPPPPPPPPVCQECGTVASIEPVKAKGSGSGAGAVLGAIAGGVIGHQFGGGSGKDIATAAGAVAGGAAGHEAEKRLRGTAYFKVGVNMENGSFRSVNVADASALAVGAKVRVIGENIQLR